MVGGVVHDADEWSTRQKANLDWIDSNYQQHKNSMKAMVLFAHADPDVPSNSPFYEPFKTRLSKVKGATDDVVEKIREEAKHIIGDKVLPAFKELEEYVYGPYSRHLKPLPGLLVVPRGEEIYQACLE